VHDTNESQPKSPRRLERYNNTGNTDWFFQSELDRWRDGGFRCLFIWTKLRGSDDSAIPKKMWRFFRAPYAAAISEEFVLTLLGGLDVCAREYWAGRFGRVGRRALASQASAHGQRRREHSEIPQSIQGLEPTWFRGLVTSQKYQITKSFIVIVH